MLERESHDVICVAAGHKGLGREETSTAYGEPGREGMGVVLRLTLGRDLKTVIPCNRARMWMQVCRRFGMLHRLRPWSFILVTSRASSIMTRALVVFPFLIACVGIQLTATAQEVIVRDTTGLKRAIRVLKAGQVLKLGPGEYAGGHFIRNLNQVTIEALDPSNRPVIKGGATGIQFVRCNELTVRNIIVKGQTSNGLNLDDGGQFDKPVIGITLENVEVTDIGPKGNFDGIKCSGLDQLTIRNCTVNGWGGEAVDMVGCHDVLITGCRFEGKTGFSTTHGVQAKGGSANVTIEKCHFTGITERPINAGGKTDLNVFRPAGTKYEARGIVVRENTISGSPCATAFVGVDGGEFSNNTILFPTKWIFRILQENTAAGFIPCRNVTIKNNKIVFLRSQVKIEINTSAGTEPKSFVFEGNYWYAEDQPTASKPKLPSLEVGGVYGVDPRK